MVSGALCTSTPFIYKLNHAGSGTVWLSLAGIYTQNQARTVQTAS